ncbi:GNAT family N-acetyltransferase [Desulfopila sp. IMCC35008]|uniref:GNAT family N-acetyltransferase n=1 Tax=Desulfopila sp. IMCC35008 TaxID=2653858 RepID=UPI0013D84C23|nr:GNAT family protein [Desulfopila sp. IMCC35008]
MTTIKGHKINLRPLDVADTAVLFSYRSLPEVYRYQQWLPESVADALSFIESYGFDRQAIRDRWNQFAVIETPSGQLIGDCGFCLCSEGEAEIGYTIMPTLQGRGHGTDCVKTLITFLFDQLPLHSIKAVTDPGNRPSISLLQRLAFTLTSLSPKATCIRGELCDDATYHLRRESWVGEGHSQTAS